ncbi:hypothetical protein BASA61_006088 [Batrachochytrium salamandrivorans]|nr:hypothetical protein BASA61_006088 [Batrachochytrium salamandrivorans]KAH9266379.1 hypothetical protein BASA83_010621 [Batrachochytrium salamandrivorans]KAJ1334580.1 hypothetical protein BSLG_007735 [Batrachochytrium salamandrivorans]
MNRPPPLLSLLPPAPSQNQLHQQLQSPLPLMLQQQQLQQHSVPGMGTSTRRYNHMDSQQQFQFDQFQGQQQQQSIQQQQLNELLLFSSSANGALSSTNPPQSSPLVSSSMIGAGQGDGRFPDVSATCATPTSASELLFMNVNAFDPDRNQNQFQQQQLLQRRNTDSGLTLAGLITTESMSNHTNSTTANPNSAGNLSSNNSMNPSTLSYRQPPSYVTAIQTSQPMFPPDIQSPLNQSLSVVDHNGRLMSARPMNYDGSPCTPMADFLSIPSATNSARQASGHRGSIMGLEALTAGLHVDQGPASAHIQPSPNSSRIVMVPSPFIRTIQSPMNSPFNSPFNSPMEPSFRSPVGPVPYGKFMPSHRSSLLSPEQSANALVDFLTLATHPLQENAPYVIPISPTLPSAGKPKKTFEDFLAENGLLDPLAAPDSSSGTHMGLSHSGSANTSLPAAFDLPDQQRQQQHGLLDQSQSPGGHQLDDRDGVHDSVPDGKFWITLKTPLQTLYQCPHPDCLKTFTRPYNLKSHYRSHTGERPFKCEVCSQAFARKHDLKRHHKLHEGQKPFSCPACRKGFARSDALRRHLRPLETNKESACTLRLRLIAEIAKNRTMADIPRLSQEVEDKDVDLVERMIRGDLDEILTFAFTMDNEETMLREAESHNEAQGLNGIGLNLNMDGRNIDLKGEDASRLSTL